MPSAEALTPTLALLGVVALSWRREWVGAVVFVGLAVAYAYLARRHPTWVLGISAPLLVVGLLFLGSWGHHRRLRDHHADRDHDRGRSDPIRRGSAWRRR